MVKRNLGGVAAGHSITADAGAELLADGGNAFDAVCAAMATAMVAEPILASPGGGGFLMAFDAARGRTGLVDFFAQTPRQHAGDDVDVAEIYADFGPATQAFHVGAGCAATPGVVPGLFAIHRERGRVPMSRVLEPAIRAATEGVTVTTYQAYLAKVAQAIVTYGADARAYFAPEGETWRVGDVVRNPQFADVLDCLGREGERFYTAGELGQAVLALAGSGAGHLSEADLRRYEVQVRKPLAADVRGMTVHLNPAPAAGGLMIALALRLLEPERRSTTWPPGPTDLVRVLRDSDRLRLAAPQLKGVGDLAGAFALSDKRLAAALAEVSTRRWAPRGTTHISVVDGDGNAAALTVSNGTGCGRMVPGCGFMLNNMLGEDDVTPEGVVGPWPTNQRLASMMAPTLIALPSRGGHIASGSGGSARIRSAMLQVIARLTEQPDAVEDAVAAPRVHADAMGAVDFEQFDLPEEIQRDLLSDAPDARAWPDANMFFGGVHVAARRADGSVHLAADSRREGATASA